MTLRRGNSRTYTPTHPQFQPLGTHTMRSCGKCGTHVTYVGGARHRVYGWIGNCCAVQRAPGNTKR